RAAIRLNLSVRAHLPDAECVTHGIIHQGALADGEAKATSAEEEAGAVPMIIVLPFHASANRGATPIQTLAAQFVGHRSSSISHPTAVASSSMILAHLGQSTHALTINLLT